MGLTGTLTETDYTVMLVLLLLLSAVGLVWLGAFLQKRNEKPTAEALKAGPDPGPTAGRMPSLPPTTAEQVVKRMEQHLSELQKQLNMDLAQLQSSMEADRADTERHVARVRDMASEHRLTLTLFELFESLKTLPKKGSDAQAIDRAWHGQVGIEPDDVLLPSEDSDPWKIYFKLEGIWYLLRVLERKYSRIDYYEITLHDEDGRLLAEVRARPDASRAKLDKEFVSSLHVGPWLSAFIALRLRMDHRLQRTLMEAASRDVDAMKRSFRILQVGKKVETASD
ncbi:MAG: hypothetical protein EBX44_14455 [Betaproteobacteria bacterium]|nr:hypothetical protein [Betaproteobacteria bacterium]